MARCLSPKLPSEINPPSVMSSALPVEVTRGIVATTPRIAIKRSRSHRNPDHDRPKSVIAIARNPHDGCAHKVYLLQLTSQLVKTACPAGPVKDGCRAAASALTIVRGLWRRVSSVQQESARGIGHKADDRQSNTVSAPVRSARMVLGGFKRRKNRLLNLTARFRSHYCLGASKALSSVDVPISSVLSASTSPFEAMRKFARKRRLSLSRRRKVLLLPSLQRA